MREIELTQGYKALVDDEDYVRTAIFNWCIHKKADRNLIYVVRNIYTDNNRATIPYMQTLGHYILGIDPSVIVTYLDNNPLNNCKTNLRIATWSQSKANTGISIANTSGHRGVTWRKNRQFWIAGVVVQGRYKYLGSSKCKECAAILYNIGAKEYFGEFASLNDIKEHECGKFGE